MAGIASNAIFDSNFTFNPADYASNIFITMFHVTDVSILF